MILHGEVYCIRLTESFIQLSEYFFFVIEKVKSKDQVKPRNGFLNN